MRRLALLAPILTLAAASPAAEGERIFMVAGFDRIRVEGPFQVEVSTGSPRAVARGDSRALDQVSVRSESGALVVSTGPLGWEARSGSTPLPIVHVTVPALRAVSINGGSRVRIAEMKGGRVDLSLSGSGAIDVGAVRAEQVNATVIGTGAMTLGGTALRGRLRTYGAGAIDAAGLSLGDAVLRAEGSGDIRVAVRFTAMVAALGTGGVYIAGKPECRISGPGPVECLGTVIRRK